MIAMMKQLVLMAAQPALSALQLFPLRLAALNSSNVVKVAKLYQATAKNLSFLLGVNFLMFFNTPLNFRLLPANLPEELSSGS
jgi:hypothetical protein